MNDIEAYNIFKEYWKSLDEHPKNVMYMLDSVINKFKEIQYEDPIIGFHNDLTPIRSSELV